MEGFERLVTDAAPTTEDEGQRARTRRRILDAAVRRIASEGIDDVRIARIAMDAGVSASLVHYHFDSREALLVEAIEHSYELVGTVRMAAASEDASATIRLRAQIDACLPEEGQPRNDFLLWTELWLRAARRPELHRTAGRLYARLHAWMLEAVEEVIAAGGLVVEDPARATDRLLALLDGYGVRVLIGDPAMSLERARDEVWAAVAQDLGLRR
jgi:AcrR family transcriptional regulator